MSGIMRPPSGHVFRVERARGPVWYAKYRLPDDTFGTRMIAKADIRQVQEWMGHADVQTTMRYRHYAPRTDDAALVAEAFALDRPAGVEGRTP